MALTKVRGGAIDNPLTLGGGSASDNSIIFDGNAQDFHIGLDDSTDSLTIGLGSTLGTTSHMVIDATGAISKPLQPAFNVHPSSKIENLGTGTTTVSFGTERIDANGDFASNTFTAPVTGKYQLQMFFYFDQMNSDSNYIDTFIETSNRSYYGGAIDPRGFDTGPTVLTFGYSVLADMDANDTAVVKYVQASGTTQVDINQGSHFSGFLVA